MGSLPKWTRAEAVAAGVGVNADAVIAQSFGVTRQAVYAARKRLGIPSPGEALLETRRSLVRSLVAEGMDREAGARALGISPSAASTAAKRLGLRWRKRSPTGRPTKLTEDRIVAALREAGSVVGASDLLDCSPSSVRYHVKAMRLVERGIIAWVSPSPPQTV